MKRIFSRGLYLEQYKEPALSRDISFFYNPDYVYIPLDEDAQMVTEKGFNTSTAAPLYIPGDQTQAKVYPGVDGFFKEEILLLEPGNKVRKYARINRIENLTHTEESPCDTDSLSYEEIVDVAYEYGIRDETDGQSLHDKLHRMREHGVKTILADALEDEPLVSAYTCLLLQRTDEVIKGLALAARAVGAEKTQVCIYGDLGDIRTKIPRRYGEIPFRRIAKKYPARQNLVAAQGADPLSFIGVGALYHLWQAARYRRAHNTCFITVAGDCILTPVNMEVRLGTPIYQILSRAGISEEPSRIIRGGSMTGVCIDNMNLPVEVTTKSVFAFADSPEKRHLDCCGCGKCVDICPSRLLPYYLYQLGRAGDYEECARFGAAKCTQCGLCSYICPSKVDLLAPITKAMQNIEREEDKPE